MAAARRTSSLLALIGAGALLLAGCASGAAVPASSGSASETPIGGEIRTEAGWLDGGRFIGIVTDADLLYKEVKPCVPQYVNLLGANIYYGNLKEYQQGFKKLFACTAEQLMTKKVIMAGPDATMEDLASVMVAEHLKAIPIVKDKKLLGMVERKNILKQLYNEYGENTQ